MKTILVDDEELSMKLFENDAGEINYINIVATFTDALEAEKYVKTHKVDLAVLDIRMAEIDGITLGKNLRSINPNILLIYATGYEEYALDAIKMHAAAYLLKPFSKEEIEYAIESARLLSQRYNKKVFAKTFGHFDLFINGKAVVFKSSKAKELLALLIDRRGGVVTTEQIISALWENRPNDESTQNLCSKTAKTLKKELEEYGIDDIVIYNRGNRRIDPQRMECDLFKILKGDKEVKNLFVGEYLIDYSWAESTLATLYRYI